MEVILGLIKLIGWFVIIFAVFFTVTFVRIFFKELEKAKLQQDDEMLKTTMLVYVEKINGMLHMYDKMTHWFIAQGSNEDELWDNAFKRCPEYNIVLDQEDGNLIVMSEKIKGGQ